jgi:hypothetical protein
MRRAWRRHQKARIGLGRVQRGGHAQRQRHMHVELDLRLPGNSANTGCAMPSLNCERISRREATRWQRLAPGDDRRTSPARPTLHEADSKGAGPACVDALADFRDAFPPPRPDRGLTDGRFACAAALRAEIEVRRIDADEQRRDWR